MNDLAVVVLVFGNLMYNTHMLPSERISGNAVKEEISKAVSLYSHSIHCGLSIKDGKPPKSPSSPDLTALAAVEEGAPAESMTKVPRPNNCQPHRRLDMISSLSLGSERLDTSSSVTLSPESLPLPRKELISSLSQGSGSNGPKRSSNRSVTFGMAYYSEGNDDGSELALPIAPPSHKEVPAGPVGVLPLEAERRFSYDSIARFSCDSIQHGAPPRHPPRRTSFSSVNSNDTEEANTSSHNEGSPNRGPPQQPTRMPSHADPMAVDDDSSSDG